MTDDPYAYLAAEDDQRPPAPRVVYQEAEPRRRPQPGPFPPPQDDVSLMIRAARTQVRIPLKDPIQARAALLVLRTAVERALMWTERADRTDNSVLMTVRALLKDADATINRHKRR